MAAKPVTNLSEEEGRVLAAVSLVEAEGGRGFIQEIAAASQMSFDDVHRVLSRLLNPLDLIREVPTDEPDWGPQYSVKER
jgi:hypothetical protein